jgi:hypothetical protein
MKRKKCRIFWSRQVDMINLAHFTPFSGSEPEEVTYFSGSAL